MTEAFDRAFFLSHVCGRLKRFSERDFIDFLQLTLLSLHARKHTTFRILRFRFFRGLFFFTLALRSWMEIFLLHLSFYSLSLLLKKLYSIIISRSLNLSKRFFIFILTCIQFPEPIKSLNRVQHHILQETLLNLWFSFFIPRELLLLTLRGFTHLNHVKSVPIIQLIRANLK